MFSILYAHGMAIADLVKSRARLEAEILLLRHQLNLALRHAPPRVRLRRGDRAFMIWMVRLWPSLLDVVQVVQPETLLHWHRAGFRIYWRWKSRKRVGRPKINRDLQDLIRRMSLENPMWGRNEHVRTSQSPAERQRPL
jgi:putative transposase